MKKKLHIDVIIVTRNRPSQLIETIKSLSLQVRRPNQIVVVSSSDEPFFIQEKALIYRKLQNTRFLSYYHILHVNKVRNLNYALSKIGKVDIVAFIDDDCVAPIDWLKRIEQFHVAYPEVAMLTGQYISNQHSYLVRSYLAGITMVEKRLIVSEYLFGGNASIRVSKVPILRFDKRFDRCEDYEFVQRNKRLGAVVLMDPSLMVRTTFPEAFGPYCRRLLKTGFYEYLVNEIYNAPAKDLYTPGKRFALLYTFIHLPVTFVRSTIFYFYRGQSAYLYPGHLLYEAIRVFGMLMALYKYRFQAPFRKRFAAHSI